MAIFGSVAQNLITVGVLGGIIYFIYTKLRGGKVKDAIGGLFSNDNENLGGGESWLKKKE